MIPHLDRLEADSIHILTELEQTRFFERAGRLLAQRRRAEKLGGSELQDGFEQVLRCARLAPANREDDEDGQPFQAPCEVVQVHERRRVRPVRRRGP